MFNNKSSVTPNLLNPPGHDLEESGVEESEEEDEGVDLEEQPMLGSTKRKASIFGPFTPSLLNSNQQDTLGVIREPIRDLSFKSQLDNNKSLQAMSDSLKDNPAHGTLQEIGRRYLIDNPEKDCSYYAQKTLISPILRVVLNLRGHTYPTMAVFALAFLGDIIYCLVCLFKYNSGIYAA